ncbi:hypothetical protein ABZV14_07830 [Streptosporangium canum]|uniref:hypothetical protein n=1 Tax=Streptosporangium canum TaxID=324952 RepID=UPI0033B65566
MADAGIRVQVSIELAALTRANIIGHVARDLASTLPAIRANTLKSIIHGFREAILSRVEFLISNDSNELVGYMAIEVDWKRYSIAVVEESSRNVFQIDPEQPVSDQVAPLLARTRSYIQQACKEINGVRCEAVYNYREAHGEEAEAKRIAFNKKYNLKDLNENSEKRLREARLDKKLVAVDSNLPEMSVTFKRKKVV